MSIVSRRARFMASRAVVRYLVVAAVLVSLFAVARTAAAETLSSGSLPVGNLTPFVLTRLEPGVPRPVRGQIGKWSLDTTMSYGNTFIMSGNVRCYLEERNERRALDARDIAALDAAGEDYYYLDVNVTRVTLEASIRFTETLAGFARLPVIHRGGGHLDSLIEDFHDLAGFDGAGRDLVARNGFQGVARIGGDRVTQLEPATGTYVADPVFGLRYEPGDWLGWSWQMAAALKPSWQPARIIVANGATDASVQIAARRPVAGGMLWLAAENVWAGESELFPTTHRATIPGLQAIYEPPVRHDMEILLQAGVSASTINTSGNQLAELSQPEYQFTIGLRRHTPSATYAFALTENIANLDNSSDIAAHVSVTWRFNPAPALLSLFRPVGSRFRESARR